MTMAKIIVAIDYPEADAESLRLNLEEAADDWFPDVGSNMISIEKDYLPDDLLNNRNVSLEFIGIVESISEVSIKLKDSAETEMPKSILE
jgi:hypothetical protein